MLPRFFIGIIFISFSVFAGCKSEQERKVPDTPAVDQPLNDFALLEEELSKDTSNVEMRTMLATRYYSSGDLIKAAYHFLKIYNQDPKNYVALSNLGNIYYDSQQDIKAIEFYEKALAIDPNLSEAYSALCHNKNRYEYDALGAEAACKRALELDPNSSVAHKTFANFLYTRGRFDEALAEIRRAMDLQPVSYRNQQMYALTLYYSRRYG